jgi:hypothetical protein
MSDHFKFDVSVSIYDMRKLEYDYRGQEIKDECKAVVERVLEERGFKKYREDYSVFV